MNAYTPLVYADVCTSCPIVYDRREHKCCPLCGNYSVLHLATVLNRRPKPVEAR